jgi:hypothetical protein
MLYFCVIFCVGCSWYCRPVVRRSNSWWAQLYFRLIAPSISFSAHVALMGLATWHSLVGDASLQHRPVHNQWPNPFAGMRKNFVRVAFCILFLCPRGFLPFICTLRTIVSSQILSYFVRFQCFHRPSLSIPSFICILIHRRTTVVLK